MEILRNNLFSEECSATQELTENTDERQGDGKSKSHADSVEKRGNSVILGSVRLGAAKDDTVYYDQRNVDTQ